MSEPTPERTALVTRLTAAEADVKVMRRAIRLFLDGLHKHAFGIEINDLADKLETALSEPHDPFSSRLERRTAKLLGLPDGFKHVLFDNEPPEVNERKQPVQKVVENAGSVRMACRDHCCAWHGESTEALTAPDPFNEGVQLLACPKCREQSLRTCCDEPGCWLEDTIGMPTTTGYRRTCHNHQPVKA